jgi:urease accessory protein
MQATADAAVHTDGWAARLELAFERREQRTVLVRQRHIGPLRVQRPFYPEANGACHVYLLHPPGGVVSGDSLQVETTVAPRAHALVTTPAANKFYRSDGRPAQVRQHLRVAEGARLEWLPQESIVYGGADVTVHTRADLDDGAEFLGWELTCLGRPAAGERFERGQLRQRLELWRADEPLLIERACYRGGHALLAQPWGLGGEPVVGSLVCVSEHLDAACRDAVREALASIAPREAACSLLPRALVCRYLGSSTEQAKLAFAAAWAALREGCFGIAAVPPRVWAT